MANRDQRRGSGGSGRESKPAARERDLSNLAHLRDALGANPCHAAATLALLLLTLSACGEEERRAHDFFRCSAGHSCTVDRRSGLVLNEREDAAESVTLSENRVAGLPFERCFYPNTGPHDQTQVTCGTNDFEFRQLCREEIWDSRSFVGGQRVLVCGEPR